MFASGILVLSLPPPNISRIGSYLKNASRLVKNVLYIKLEPDIGTTKSLVLSDRCSSKTDLINVVPNIYRVASQAAPSLDVRIIINRCLKLNVEPEVLMTNCRDAKEDFWKNYADSVLQLQSLNEIRFLEDAGSQAVSLEQNLVDNVSSYDHGCLGGTFDDLHNGHKVLLNEAILRCKKSLTIGVTDVEMIKSKVLWELIRPVDARVESLRQYLLDVDNSLNYDIVPIKDPFGPAIQNANLECLVVSEETLRGGQKINEIRRSKQMNELELVVIKLVDDSQKASDREETKISSSNSRMRRLGELLKEPELRPNLPRRPYMIGLTGGITSGKSTICKALESMGAAVIDCDKLAHLAYMSPGSIAHDAVRKEFGDEVLNPEDQNVDRQKLSKIVFGSNQKLKLLNEIVWPATEILVKRKIEELRCSHPVIVLEVALLLEANWDKKVHQVWVSIIPEAEAIKRLKERNNLGEEDAKRRIASQMSNCERVKRANVVLCSLWDYQFTRAQVEKAWKNVVKFVD